MPTFEPKAWDESDDESDVELDEHESSLTSALFLIDCNPSMYECSTPLPSNQQTSGQTQASGEDVKKGSMVQSALQAALEMMKSKVLLGSARRETVGIVLYNTVGTMA
jgi:hypothetical protein